MIRSYTLAPLLAITCSAPPEPTPAAPARPQPAPHAAPAYAVEHAREAQEHEISHEFAAASDDHRNRGHHRHHRFERADEWVGMFDSPDRDAWQKPDAVLAALALRPDAQVADIGAGTGYFATRLARAAPQGLVYAVDLESDMVTYLGQRAAREHLSNLRPVLAQADDPQIPTAVDLVLLVDTYHHVPGRVAYFRKVASALRPGGRVVIIDFLRDAPMGPPVEHRIPPEQVAAELAQAGLRPLPLALTLPNQYALAFTRAE